MSDFVHVPKRYRNRAGNGHDHTGGLILPASQAGNSRNAVPDAWADPPPPALPDRVVAFIHGIHNAKDGRQHNAYVCDTCQGALHTYEQHPGVTPKSMAHNLTFPGSRCPGRMESAGYPVGNMPDSLGPPVMEWYRPSAEQLQTSTPRIVEHVMRGGLLMRRWMP